MNISLSVWRPEACAACSSGQRIGLPIRRPRFESLSGHLLDLFSVVPSFKSSATLANNKLVASCQLEFFLLCFIWFVSNYLSGVPVNKLNKLNTLSAINKLTIGTQFQGSLNSRFLLFWKNREIKIPRIKIPAKFNTHIEKSNQRKRNEQY